MSTTVINGIPFVPENTIDPAAGLNLALKQFDVLLQLAVVSIGSNTPPATAPAEGSRFVVGTAPTGAWAGQAGRIAAYLGGAYSFYTGRLAVSLSDGRVYSRDGSGLWSTAAAGLANPMTALGDIIRGGLNGTAQRLGIGQAGQVLTVVDGTPAWTTPQGGTSGMTSPMTSAGDLIRGGASGAAERLAAGTAGQVLTIAGGLPTWAAPASAASAPPVLTEADTARTLGLADANAYLRFTNAGASTATIPPQSGTAWAANTEIHIRRAAAGSLTLTPGSGVTLNAPSGGTLVMTDRMSVTLKRVAENVWDVIGQTVPA